MVGSCWATGTWTANAWQTDAWCPTAACTPASIGDCWTIAWCANTWANNSWCGTGPIPPTPPVRPNVGGYYPVDTGRIRRRREDVEILILGRKRV